jgi:hypothetical protein
VRQAVAIMSATMTGASQRGHVSCRGRTGIRYCWRHGPYLLLRQPQTQVTKQACHLAQVNAPVVVFVVRLELLAQFAPLHVNYRQTCVVSLFLREGRFKSKTHARSSQTQNFASCTYSCACTQHSCPFLCACTCVRIYSWIAQTYLYHGQVFTRPCSLS